MTSREVFREKQQQQQRMLRPGAAQSATALAGTAPGFIGSPGAAVRRPALGKESIDGNPVTAFLREIGLAQYAGLFISNGFDDLETLADMEHEHMKDLQIPPGHIVKLSKKFRQLGSRAQRVAGRGGASGAVPRALQNQALQPETEMATTVQMSWERVKELGTDRIGAFFYQQFFVLEPEAVKLFPLAVRQRYQDWTCEGEEPEVLSPSSDSPALRKLWGKFIDAVGSAVAGMHDLQMLVPMLQQLGMRHLGYGLEPHYFKVAEKVLIEALKFNLGDIFTKDVEMAWVMVYGIMTSTMLSGVHMAAEQAAQASRSCSSTAGSGILTPTSGSDCMLTLHQQDDNPELEDKPSPELLQAANSPPDQLPALLHELQRFGGAKS
eukprot:TRINITY_DN6469_c0_g1_i1.p1 TRINITY_DN6469_c0_g1~~TRINITY_DN6469_c0_g1_i1.p1  ORF type:complete len:380 (-),score=89.18 TRINITY_DN6469_c0_g1_i1:120-1259(-)